MVLKLIKYNKGISYISIVLIFSFSCISTKKEAYLNQSRNISYTEKDYSYILQSDDVVSVNISSITPSEYNFFEKTNELDVRIDPLLSGFLIDKKGFIHLPVIGSVNIQGLTIPEAQNKIKLLADNYLDEPTVFIRLVNFKFTLLGEVTKEGTYTVYESDINLLQAIGMGSGLTDYADRSKIRLVRSENNITSSHYVNLLSDNIIESDLYKLRPGDIIIVYPHKAKNFRRNQAANIALIFSGIATVATVIIAYDRIENN